MSVAAAPSGSVRPAIARWWVAERDHWRAASVLAPAAGVAAVLFAVVGIPPLPMMAPLHEVGLVTPTCGLTRASVALAEGRLARAFAFNPASFVLAVGVAALCLRGVVGATTGRWLHATVRPTRVVVAVAVIAVVVLWVWQQAHAGFVINEVSP